ncbi:Zinc phosphodiesterase ELAC protein 2 [Grifola frondosa]|uniref:ribonuclease Z n=1 Tax=Grifola frondosa TaxID=5627 RepID=A0A1C7MKJ3_GRIFR|nr:Zinc phosphodiesterase ELAC protein 2 [Grifola frondosa]
MLDVDLDGFMSDATSRARAEAMCQALGLQSFTCVDVYHRTRCYGTVIRHMDGWSIVFSGDTAPCGNLIKAGQNATLLIHEASMRDEEEEQARAKAHSTFRQAIDIGRKMHVQHTLLTHFSARYHKSPHTLTASSQAPILTLAYDLARLRIGDMWKMNIHIVGLECSLLLDPNISQVVFTVITLTLNPGAFGFGALQ